MRQKIIKRILALSMVGAMAFTLVACATTSSQDEPSESQPTQEVETTPTPTPSEAPTPSPDTTPIPNEDEPSEPMPSQEPTSSEPTPTQEPTPTPSEDTTPKEPQEPITTPKPTPSQEPTQTPTPTPTTTTTPPTSTPIHTHSFKGGDCSNPSTCDCGEIGSYGDHNWATRHIDEIGHMASNGTYQVFVTQCDCGFIVTSDDPDAQYKWDYHKSSLGDNCRNRCTQWYEDCPNDPTWVVDVQAHDETYCTICGAIQSLNIW